MLPVIELDTPEFWQDIHTPLADALAKSPIARSSDGGLYVLGHAEVEAVLKDPRMGAADLLAMQGLDAGPVWEWWQRLMFSNDDPFHGRIRRLVSRAFVPRNVERHRNQVAEITRSLVAEVLAAGTVDVMGTIAHDLPSMVMAALLSIPDADRREFAAWTTDIGLAFGAVGDAGVRSRVEQALANLDEYVEALVAHRRTTSGDDLLSTLIAVEESGDQLTTRELVDLVENLLFAGHDTTRGAVGVALLLMAEHPEIATLVQADAGAARPVVEEMLRYEAITFSTCRTNREPVEIAGLEVATGTPVALCLPSASRDPRRYEEPHRFDIHRADVNPPTFGAGAHYCIGAWLARAELQELVIAVSNATTRVVLDGVPRWVPFAHLRRYEALSMHWIPA